MKNSDILATFLLVSITFSPASFAGQLQRFATVPIKAEVTGLYITEQGDLFFNVQHPSGSIDPPFNRAMIGYVKDVDFRNLPVAFSNLPVAKSRREKSIVRVAIGAYGIIARKGDFASQMKGGLGAIVATKVVGPSDILAVDDLRLLRMQFQLAVGETITNRAPEISGLCLGSAMTYDIVGVAFERDVRIVPRHPRIKRIVQEQVRQQRTDNAALWCACLPFDDAAIFHLHWHLQPTLDVEQHPWAIRMVADSFGNGELYPPLRFVTLEVS